uniref:Uncharacterized protein n=1 Tax=Rhizophora mucronata TaxID=61149 RepID=A0A2P2N962_RHIMU
MHHNFMEQLDKTTDFGTKNVQKHIKELFNKIAPRNKLRDLLLPSHFKTEGILVISTL